MRKHSVSQLGIMMAGSLKRNFRFRIELSRPTVAFLLSALLAMTLVADGKSVSLAQSRLSSNQVVSSPSVDCQPGQGCIRWTARYDGPGHDFDLALSVLLSPDNKRVYVTGYSPDSGAPNDYATIAYDAATGATIWTARYDSGAHWFDNGKYLAISPDGTRLFVTGDSNADGSDSNYDYLTIAYDALTGEQLWVARYDFAGGQEEVSAIAVSPDGTRVFITGGSQVADTNWDYATVAYDAATGTQLWVARHDGTAQDFDVAYGLVISPDGSHVFVTGGSDSGIPGVLNLGQDFVTLAYDASTGIQLWMATYSPSLMGYDTAQAIALSPDGTRVFVAGQSDGTDINMSSDYAVVAYDTTDGVQQWAARYDGPAQQGEQVSALAVSHDGARVFVTGASQGQTTDNDYATVAFDAATGNQLWVARYDGPAHGFDAAEAVVVSPDNTTVYVTGSSDGGTPSSSGVGPDSYVNNLDWATIAYDAATGAQEWIARLDGPVHGNDIATSMVLSPDGNSLYVTGASTAGNYLDYLTVDYDVGVPLISVASQKTHGTAGTFDVDLPLIGNPGIECRSGGETGDYTLVFSFGTPLASVSSVTASATGGGSAPGATGMIDNTDAHYYIVNLSNVPNAQYTTVSLTNVTDSAGNFSSSLQTTMGVLLGDVNGDGQVDSSDLILVKQQTLQPVNDNPGTSNFREDVNADGSIDSSDLIIVKRQTLTGLP